MFLVIPIPHKMSGCITGGEKYLDWKYALKCFFLVY
jgi:hypothetical protein